MAASLAGSVGGVTGVPRTPYVAVLQGEALKLTGAASCVLRSAVSVGRAGFAKLIALMYTFPVLPAGSGAVSSASTHWRSSTRLTAVPEISSLVQFSPKSLETFIVMWSRARSTKKILCVSDPTTRWLSPPPWPAPTALAVNGVRKGTRNVWPRSVDL